MRPAQPLRDLGGVTADLVHVVDAAPLVLDVAAGVEVEAGARTLRDDGHVDVAEALLGLRIYPVATLEGLLFGGLVGGALDQLVADQGVLPAGAVGHLVAEGGRDLVDGGGRHVERLELRQEGVAQGDRLGDLVAVDGLIVSRWWLE